ncbi:MAG: HpsJ family protein [Leptolyngbyaceae cyanobacterium bins.302]|nr:HpsJ family protein [Leptolyngbyaceae cyanobacterium bins.302]
MTTLSSPNSYVGSYNPKGLCQIVGLACLAGFVVDLFVITFPPNLGNLQWRIAFMQQTSDRSIILLFGLALMMFGMLDFRRWRRRLAMFCLILGAVFCLSSILVIRDGLAFQQEALKNISNQASQVQSQIQRAQSNPGSVPNVTPEQLNQLSGALSNQVNTLKESAKTTTLKTGISSVGNLIIVGLALIGLGQYGARPPKN